MQNSAILGHRGVPGSGLLVSRPAFTIYTGSGGGRQGNHESTEKGCIWEGTQHHRDLWMCLVASWRGGAHQPLSWPCPREWWGHISEPGLESTSFWHWTPFCSFPPILKLWVDPRPRSGHQVCWGHPGFPKASESCYDIVNATPALVSFAPKTPKTPQGGCQLRGSIRFIQGSPRDTQSLSLFISDVWLVTFSIFMWSHIPTISFVTFSHCSHAWKNVSPFSLRRSRT